MAQAAVHSAVPRERTIRIIASNRAARHEYFITDEFEAGIVLTGTEVKSLRDGKVQLAGGYARMSADELWIENIHISAYKHGNMYNHEPLRKRKLLIHRKELRKLAPKLATKGITLVPLSIYFKGNKVKISLGVARGKKAYDKRESIKERDIKRELDRD
ncbi:MAG TPA: SsrA-binding protein SmpB [Candidatus Kapabacteria bacterium]|nr:SsrA-binding protein SmpB [Candidatus Kapabacteria bacterium]